MYKDNFLRKSYNYEKLYQGVKLNLGLRDLFLSLNRGFRKVPYSELVIIFIRDGFKFYYLDYSII